MRITSEEKKRMENLRAEKVEDEINMSAFQEKSKIKQIISEYIYIYIYIYIYTHTYIYIYILGKREKRCRTRERERERERE